MSEFKGIISELENILVDNFTLKESKTCFFLSHCHTDHMKGLQELFSNLHKKSGQYLYCSQISRLYILNHPNIRKEECSKLIKELTLPTLITVPASNQSQSYQLMVTPIPAGHCPGSIMFLFETVVSVILFTGDFRISKTDVQKIKYFHKNNEIKHIDKIYLDCTFLSEEYWNFPSRTESINEIIKLCENWLQKGLDFKVFLHLSAIINYELLFVKIAKKLKCKIYVNKFSYNVFKNIPEISFALTSDFNNVRIYAAYKNEILDIQNVNNIPAENILKIRLQAFNRKSQNAYTSPEILIKESENTFTACFSTHCSFSELIDFLNYLKPKKVEPFAYFAKKETVESHIQQLMSNWTLRLEKKRIEPNETYFPSKKHCDYKINFGNEIEKCDSVEKFFFS